MPRVALLDELERSLTARGSARAVCDRRCSAATARACAGLTKTAMLEAGAGSGGGPHPRWPWSPGGARLIGGGGPVCGRGGEGTT